MQGIMQIHECTAPIINNFLSTNDGNDYAAWAQAIASFVAACAAFVVIYIQRNHQQERDEKLQNELANRCINTVISLAGGTREKATLLDTWSKGGGSASANDLFFMNGELQSILIGINSISLSNISDFNSLMNITSLQSLTSLLKDTCEDALGKAKISITWASNVSGIMNTLLPEIDKHLNELIKLNSTRV